MSSSNSRYRLRSNVSKHTQLITQQRRLRHLTCIVGRNINPKLVPSTRLTSKNSLLSLYFTLHPSYNHNIILYKSETLDNTLNPNWKEFDTETFPNASSFIKASSTLVCIWASRKSSTFSLILSYDVDFSGLQYSKDQLRALEQCYDSNCIIFRLFDGYYALPANKGETSNEEQVFSQVIKVPNEQVALSYKKPSLLRAHFSLKAIHQTKLRIFEVEQQMVQLLATSKAKREKNATKEALVFQNNLLNAELQSLQAKVLAERTGNEEAREVLINRERELYHRKDELEKYINAAKVCHTLHIDRREILLKVSAQLNYRRQQLASDLIDIYMIRELPLNDSNKRELNICNVRLPNSEEFTGENETMLAVAIGYVAHLVQLMARVMDLPLRYPIRAMGSRSSVQDLVTDKLSDKEREFPLFSKGKDKFHFRYGMFLLNKDVAQLRYHHHLGTSDLRNTLMNIKNLFETKYSVIFGADIKRLSVNRVISPPTVAPTLSGLPNVHVKAQQHRFISRKNNKLRKSNSLPNVTSPDLIQTPIEEILKNPLAPPLSAMDAVNEGNGLPEDCLISLHESNISRHLSDTLIIPGPFEERADESVLI